MALALAEGFCRAGLLAPADITVYDPHPPARERLAARMPGIVFAESARAAAAAAVETSAVWQTTDTPWPTRQGVLGITRITRGTPAIAASDAAGSPATIDTSTASARR